jgi:hypothetical protein
MLTLLPLALATSLGALDANVADSLTFRGMARQLDVDVPRIEESDVRIDGRLDENLWSEAAVLTDFSQYEPVEGIPSIEATEVRVFYTSDAIYFGVRAFDRQPELILARLGERDESARSDDWVRIWLDTFDDNRQAYIFYVNPLGIQTDGLWIEGLQRSRGGGGGGGGSSVDFSPDFIWESEGRVDEEGWTAEIRIPYVSLRFRQLPVQRWGFNVVREVKRRGFKQSWAPLTQEISSTLAQGGHLVGLRDLRPKRLVELNPVATGRRTGELRDEAFVHEDPTGEFGLNTRVGLTQNLILDATYNPDFSQVEADADRITLNERFALFFPEKRPFFLEGTEIFRTPKPLVYTRQIADPELGAKLTGKLGSFNVGYLGAWDESPSSLFGGTDNAIFNLVRAGRDVGTGSTVGFLYTDRTLEGGDVYNRVVSADARVLFRGRFTLTTQLAGSWTALSSDDQDTGFKPLVYATLERSGRTFAWQLRFDGIHPDFRTRSGFIPRVGDVELFGSTRWTHYGRPGALLERLAVELRSESFFDHDEFWEGTRPYEAEVQLQPTFSFRGDRSLTIILRSGYFRFREEDYDSYQVQDLAGELGPFQLPDDLSHMLALTFFPRMRLTNEAQLSGRIYFREIPIFAEAARGLELLVAPSLTLRPTSAVSLSLSHTLSRIHRRRDDTQFSTANISRGEFRYQFNKAVLARIIGQYNLARQDALRDPTTERPIWIDGEPETTTESGTFQGQFLFQYEPSPGTIFYAGYSRVMSGDYSYQLSRMDPTDDGLFVKLSYLFRL